MADGVSRRSLGEIEKSALEPDESTTGEQISRGQLTGNLLSAFNHAYDQLETIWNRIGFKSLARNKRSHVLLCHLEGFLESVVSEEECLLIELKNKIKLYGKEIIQLSEELNVPPYEPDDSIAILELEATLRTRADDLCKEKKHRLVRLKELRQQEKQVCDRLKMTPFSISEGEVPSKEELREMKQHVEMLQKEQESRLRKFSLFRQEISTLMEQMGIGPTTVIEHDILENEEKFHLSEENLATGQKLLENLRIQKLDQEQKANSLRETLCTLWQCVDKDEDERKSFLDQNPGFKHSTIQLFKKEVQRCQTLRKQNMKLYIENARQSLRELWSRCCLSKEQIPNVSIMNDEPYTEFLLDLHEIELAEWNRYYDQHATVLSHVQKLENMWASLKEFEGRQKDPNRLANRGGALLQEEKERRTFEKVIFKVEKILLKRSSEYEEKGQHFLVFGKTLSEYVTQKRETHNSEKTKTLSRLRSSSQKSIKYSTTETSKTSIG